MSNYSIIKKVIWIDKKVFNDENKGYKTIMEQKYKLEVKCYDDAYKGIEAIKKEDIYLPIFIITSGSIYPEFYRFFKNAVTYIKNLPVQIIFTSSVQSFLEKHKNDEIGQQIGKFYNLGGVTCLFSQVENFISNIIKKLEDYKVNCVYDYEHSRDFRGIQTFSYINQSDTLEIPQFFKDILEKKTIPYEEISTFIKFMLANFANFRICDLLKGMILFNDIPEPILSKFFARAYTLQSGFYNTMNKNLMKKNYQFYSTYIKLLYKGISNKSYKPKTDCVLYRGTKLEKFEIEMLQNMLEKKKENKKIPIIYSTSFLSFSTDNIISQSLANRRISGDNRDIVIKLNPLNQRRKNEIMETNAFLAEISFYHTENEVLFFPFSSFELVDIEEKGPMTYITFDYSFRFKNKAEINDNNGCYLF